MKKNIKLPMKWCEFIWEYQRQNTYENKKKKLKSQKLQKKIFLKRNLNRNYVLKDGEKRLGMLG